MDPRCPPENQADGQSLGPLRGSRAKRKTFAVRVPVSVALRERAGVSDRPFVRRRSTSTPISFTDRSFFFTHV